MTTVCPSLEVLRQYLEDVLAPEAESALVTHVEGCGPCRQAMDTLTTDDGLPKGQPAFLTAIRPAFHNRLAGLADGGKSTSSPWLHYTPFRDTPSAAKQDTLPLTLDGEATRLGNYDILDELGRGGMGVVYLARDTRLGRLVALKMIRGSTFDAKEQQVRFLAEAQAIAQLRHPHIVQLYEIGTLEGRLYCALEYVPGGSLAKHLDGKPLPASQTAALVELVARAVHHAHQNNLIHRDLKPANILLMPNAECRMPNENKTIASFDIRHSSFGIPKVTDFGLAKRLDTTEGLTQTGLIVGTPHYMAPEQAQVGKKVLGPATDIYALGAILFECLTGRPPFLGESALEVIDALLNDEPVPPRRLVPQVPLDLETICLKCLQKEPARRYATAAALADDLGRFLRGEPIRARPVSRTERLWRWSRRNPLATAFLATLALGVLAMAGLAWWALDERDQAARHAQQAEENAERAARNERHAADQARLAEEKRQEADKQRLEADKQRAEALDNLKRAKRAVDNCFRLTQEHALFQGEEQKDRRAVLLEQAKPFYEQFVQQRSDDPEYLEAQADILNKLGLIYTQVGPWQKSEEAYRLAIVAYEKVFQRRPQGHALKSQLAAAWNNLAVLQNQQERSRDAMASYLRAEKLYQEFFQAQPQNYADQKNLSGLWRNLALLHSNVQQHQEALAYLTKAQQLDQRLVDAQPDQYQYRLNLANTLIARATLQMEIQRHGPARQDCREARRHLESLAAELPSHLEVRQSLAACWQLEGYLCMARNQGREAIAAFTQARQYFETVLAARPRNTPLAANLGEIYSYLGVLHSDLGNLREALTCFAQTQTLLEGVLAREPQLHRVRQPLHNAFARRAYMWSLLHRFTEAADDWRRAADLAQGEAQRESQRWHRICLRNARLERAAYLAMIACRPAGAGCLAEQTGWLTLGLLWLSPPNKGK
jgi:eukaryotic-like serine/threonine-protein kinase